MISQIKQSTVFSSSDRKNNSSKHYKCVVGGKPGYMSIYNLPDTKVKIHGMTLDAEWGEWFRQRYVYGYTIMPT